VPICRLPLGVAALARDRQVGGGFHRLRYARIHADGREYLYSASLSELAQRLPAQDFLRIHRSTLVRIGAVHRLAVGAFSSLAVVLADGTAARVGRTYTAEVRARLLGR